MTGKAESGINFISCTSKEGASIEVSQHGGHLLSWKVPSGEELIFVSSEAVFKPPKAIRGGTPVCFPQFSDMGPLAAHGFARNSEWKVETPADMSSICCSFTPSAEQLEAYPHPFKMTLTTSMDTLRNSKHCLRQTLSVVNNGDTAMSFTCALHTYFKLADAAQARVEGLQGSTYLDNLQGRETQQQHEESVRFASEVDRIYTPGGAVKLIDVAGGKAITLDCVNSGFPDVVVWNPWVDKAKATADFGDEEYKQMCCLEPAIAASGPFTLDAGACWSASYLLTYEAL